MSETWWLGPKDLDKDQRKIVMDLPLDQSYLVEGPPGSGKTNLLLLRANNLYLAGRRNIGVVVFTRSLREFIASGGRNYDFPESKISTLCGWQRELLKAYGIAIDPPADFEKQRAYLLKHSQELVSERKLKNVFDAILLDEGQDYSPDEIVLFRQLAKVLFCVADSRQKIYKGKDPLAKIREVVNDSAKLRFHYRNGLKICRVADAIAKDTDDYEKLEETYNYKRETENPSSVDRFRCADFDEQATLVIERLHSQRKAFPDELIGIIAPKREDVRAMWNRLKDSPFSPFASLQLEREHDVFDDTTPICVCTLSSAKGLEFRALHIICTDALRKFEHNRNMAYMGVTRAKTSLSIYHSGDLHGYFESALDCLEPPPEPPALPELFGRGK